MPRRPDERNVAAIIRAFTEGGRYAWLPLAIAALAALAAVIGPW